MASGLKSEVSYLCGGLVWPLYVELPIILPPNLFHSWFLSQSVIPASDYGLIICPQPLEIKVKMNQRSWLYFS